MAETNFEHYLKEIIASYLTDTFDCDFIRDKVLRAKNCSNFTCDECRKNILKWFNESYEKPKIEIDWTKVPVDTPVFVSDELDEAGHLVRPLNRHFNNYEDGVVVFCNGVTSFTQEGFSSIYKYAELAREEDVEKYKVQEEQE